jgi:hypothetical protein
LGVLESLLRCAAGTRILHMPPIRRHQKDLQPTV